MIAMCKSGCPIWTNQAQNEDFGLREMQGRIEDYIARINNIQDSFSSKFTSSTTTTPNDWGGGLIAWNGMGMWSDVGMGFNGSVTPASSGVATNSPLVAGNTIPHIGTGTSAVARAQATTNAILFGIPGSRLQLAAAITMAFGPSAAFEVRSIETDSRARAEDFAVKHQTIAPDTGLIGPDHNQADAYRHFIGSVYLTRNISLEAALFVTNRNELMTLAGDGNVISYDLRTGVATVRMTNAVLQDVWNDAAGRNLASDPRFQNYTSSELFNYALENNMLIQDAFIDLNNPLDNSAIEVIGARSFVQEGDWRIDIHWNLNNGTLIIFDQEGHSITRVAGSVLP